MRAWEREPTEFSLLVAHSGARAEAIEFLRKWALLVGHSDLEAARLGGPKLADALVFRIGHLVDYSLLEHWLTHPHWSIFYRKDDGRIGPKSPAGRYLAWGFEDGLVIDDGVPVLVHPDGSTVSISEKFKNAFEILGVEFNGSKPVKAKVAPHAVNPEPLPVKLVPQSARPANPGFELARLQERILELQTQAEALDWWCAEAEFDVEMRIYVEDRRPPKPLEDLRPRWMDDARGKVGALRRWFTSVPASWLDEYLHARVEVEGLLALHLVIPKQEGHVPAASLPETPWRLVLDRNWRRKQRKVFVTDGYVLRPAPPMGDNPLVTELLAGALWHGPARAVGREPSDGSDTILVILRSDEAGEHRFTVPASAFQPLASRVADLNFEVGVEWHEFPEKRPDYIERAVTGAAARVEDQVKAQKNAMKAALDGVWTVARADIVAYRKHVSDALDKIGALERLLGWVNAWHGEVTGFEIAQREIWISFVQEVLRRHRQLPPVYREATFAWLADLLSIESEASQPDANDVAGRARIAGRLRQLADVIEGRPAAPPSAETPSDDQYQQW
jgi:hypothetical protein